MVAKEAVDGFVRQIPDPPEIRERIAENLRERQLLRQLLKLSEQRQKVREVSSK